MVKGEIMLRPKPADKSTRRIKSLVAKKSVGQRDPEKSKCLAPIETGGISFANSVSDPRLTEEENAMLAQKLWELRDAFIAMLLSKRETSHSKDFVVG